MKDKDGLRDDGKNDNRTERMMTGRFDDDGIRNNGNIDDDDEMDSTYIYKRKKTNCLMKDNGMKDDGINDNLIGRRTTAHGKIDEGGKIENNNYNKEKNNRRMIHMKYSNPETYNISKQAYTRQASKQDTTYIYLN